MKLTKLRNTFKFKISFLFAWHSMWIGIFWDKKKKWFYFLPFPTIGFILKFKEETEEDLNLKMIPLSSGKRPDKDCEVIVRFKDGKLKCRDFYKGRFINVFDNDIEKLITHYCVLEEY